MCIRDRAEAYPGPSLIIGYAPCELHGVKGGMTNCQNEMKKAVAAGYWNLFSFNPAAKAEGKNPFTLTSKAGDMSKYQEFLANETRYSRLARAFPDRAKAVSYTHLNQSRKHQGTQHQPGWDDGDGRTGCPIPAHEAGQVYVLAKGRHDRG